jgi:hypothetical protein
MISIDQALQALIGREPTPEELRKFYHVREVCEFSENDPVWSLLLAFGHYEILYHEIPGRITAETNKLIADHRVALNYTAEAVEQHLKVKLGETVADTVRKAAKEMIDTANGLIKAESRRRLLVGASWSFGMAAISIGLVCWFAFNLGASKTNAKFKMDPIATKFFDLNDVSIMMACNGAEIQKRRVGNNVYCIPFDEKNKRASGWRIQ